MVHSRRVTVARARPRASSSRAKVLMSARRAEGGGRDRAWRQAVNCRRSSVYASRARPRYPGQEPGEREPLRFGECRLDRGDSDRPYAACQGSRSPT